jgi:Glycosyltransferases involved in cell wall biogenesis
MISVIVPIYNTSEYLKKCIDSIIKQTYTELEIILVNDGSTDSCLELINKYKKQDDRIVVIDQKNHGQAYARNRALDIANGDFIGFVDSDDYIEEDMFETLIKIMQEKDSDISMVTHYREENGMVVPTSDINELSVYTTDDALKLLLMNKKVQSHLCNKLFKKELFDGLKMQENCAYEDIGIVMQLFIRAKRFVLLEIPKYHYVIRKGSTVTTKTYKKQKDFYDLTMKNYRLLKDKNNNISDYVSLYIVDSLIVNYVHCVSNGIDELASTIEKDIPLLEEAVKKHITLITSELQDFKLVILFILLWNKKFARDIVGSFWNEQKKIILENSKKGRPSV